MIGFERLAGNLNERKIQTDAPASDERVAEEVLGVSTVSRGDGGSAPRGPPLRLRLSSLALKARRSLDQWCLGKVLSFNCRILHILAEIGISNLQHVPKKGC